MSTTKFYIRICMVFTFVFLATGCASKNVKMDKGFWENKSNIKMKIGIAIHDFPQGLELKNGNQGILDYAISRSASGGLVKFLDQFSLAKFTKVQEKFSTSLSKSGFNSKIITKSVELNK